ncbi:RraA family protein [Roseibium sp.]|uniref:RraA family protein n=1 Tax=Roseibium sp. TaxID=1936156 RepID=UPI003D119738
MPLTNSLPSSAGTNELIDLYRGIATSLISDNLGRMTGATGILPYSRTCEMIGTALTVRTRPGDNKTIHEALLQLQPGQVLLVDGGGDLTQALIGEIILANATVRGAAGLVIDGAIRDVSAIRKSDTPCFARGVTHRGPYKNGPGEINVPITIGGMVVHPGDLIVGDEDGLLAVDPETALRILPAVREQEASEEEKLRALRQGCLT